MERYTDVWNRTGKDLMWDLPCEPGVTFECTRNVVEDIISCLPFMFRQYKRKRGAEITFEIDEAYRDPETYETWYRVSYKTKENTNGQTF